MGETPKTLWVCQSPIVTETALRVRHFAIVPGTAKTASGLTKTGAGLTALTHLRRENGSSFMPGNPSTGLPPLPQRWFTPGLAHRSAGVYMGEDPKDALAHF